VAPVGWTKDTREEPEAGVVGNKKLRPDPRISAAPPPDCRGGVGIFPSLPDGFFSSQLHSFCRSNHPAFPQYSLCFTRVGRDHRYPV